MKLGQSFTVAAPVETVWEALNDVMRVAPCLPGAAITDDAGDGTFKGEFKVKLGPTTAAYSGALRIDERDDEAHRVTMDAKGTDKRGNGGTKATIVSTVTRDEESGETRVDVDTDFSITGKLARFGRGGMIQDVSNRLLREFAANLQEELAGESPEPADAAAGGASSRVSAGASSPAPAESEPPIVSMATEARAGLAGESGDERASGSASRPARPAAEPLDAGGLMGDVLRDRLRAGAAPFLAGLVTGLLLAARIGSRRRA